MKREELTKKLEALEGKYRSICKQFTIDLFDGAINDISLECYICNEEEDLGALIYKCQCILDIMREDIIDHFVVARVKYIAEKRLNSIYDER